VKIQPDRRLLIPKSFYLLYYGGMAALMPFLTLHYQGVGLSGREIGILIGLRPLVRLLGGPFWAAVADVSRRHKPLLLASLALYLLSVYGIWQAQSFTALIISGLAMAFFAAPIDALVDSAVLGMPGDRRDAFGQQRLWGAVGWGLAAPLVGHLAETRGASWHFYGFFLLMALTIPVSSRLETARMGRRVAFWRGVGTMARNRWWALFLVTVFLAGLGRSAASGFMNLHMDALGAGRALIGIFATVGGLSEIPTFFYSGTLLRRWGARTLVLASLGGSLAMLLGFGWLTTPGLLVPLQLFHGPEFAAMYVAGVYYAGRAAPPGMEATARALYGAVGALAMTLGGFVGGYLYDAVGALWLFRMAALMMAASMVFYLVTVRSGQDESPT